MIQTILNALSLGGTYALASLGLGLVFGVMRLVNFAYSELITIAAYTLVMTSQMPIMVSFLFSIVVTSIAAVLMELLIYRRLRGVAPAIMLVASFGLSKLLQQIYELCFGALPRSASIAPWMSGELKFAGVSITNASLITAIVTIILLLVMRFLLNKTSFGIQLKAASADFRTARLLGVRANHLITLAFAMSGVLAAFVGAILVVGNPQVEPMFGMNMTILALVGIVIGGISSLPGSALGGFIVGVILSLLNTWLGNGRVYSYSWLFAVVFIILLVRPGGLLSKGQEMERV